MLHDFAERRGGRPGVSSSLREFRLHKVGCAHLSLALYLEKNVFTFKSLGRRGAPHVRAPQ